MDVIIPNWPAPAHIKAFSSLRSGGVSKAPYEGLNLGTHVGDDIQDVEVNRITLIKANHLPAAPVWLNQTHSTVVACLDQSTSEVVNADALFTSAKGVVCSAMTADCLPVLLTDTEGTQVAAVHAGWRGLAGGIVENAVKLFDKPVMAWLGPAIGPDAFEVGEDVLEAFTAFSPEAEKAFISKGEGKYWANMSLLATQRLNAIGVSEVYDSGLCTFSDSERFYSYRRDGVTGRQASFIWIE
ncbi:peptidoglycan editing factor PgeF [Vibrio sp. JC009]|uniref:peptidoglycan editing factor PgeF n=1 Tax=Vibrio sp. JC009 TaxID=2912314 RepID=UPI0023B16948|nr:peptidoglycan editing factor PgeF [Vibrio sp. JC009]WED22290.1 peptidoglycan editing factor PgeF [Vibrio sp. JC009]